MALDYGSVTARWTDPEGYDRFEVEFQHTSRGQSEFLKTDNHEYRFPKLPTGGCWARVRGKHDSNDWTGFEGCESPWSGVKETNLPPELGYVKANFAPGTPLGAVSQRAGHQEIFACLPDGKPVGIWSDGWWQEWYSHGAGPGPGFPAGASLTAVSRDDGFMDLFSIANDGRVYLDGGTETLSTSGICSVIRYLSRGHLFPLSAGTQIQWTSLRSARVASFEATGGTAIRGAIGSLSRAPSFRQGR